MARIKCVGQCVSGFLIAIVLDIVGLILLFVGIFADLRVDGRFYGDFLIYTGSLVLFVSLAFWIIWYVGNVQVSEEQLGLKKRSSIMQLARKLSERLSQKLNGDQVKYVEEDEDYSSQVGPHKASRVTWGRSTAYHNEGYEESVDSPSVEQEPEPEENQMRP